MTQAQSILSALRLCFIPIFLEREVDAQVYIEVGIEGGVLLGQFAGDAVGGNEEVEAGGFEIEYAAEAGSESAHAGVDAQ